MSPAQNADELLLTLQQILDQRLPGEGVLREAILRQAESIVEPERDASAASMDLFQLVSRMVDQYWLNEHVLPPAVHQRKAAALEHLEKAHTQLHKLHEGLEMDAYADELSQIVARLRWDLTLARLDWLARQRDAGLVPDKPRAER